MTIADFQIAVEKNYSGCCRVRENPESIGARVVGYAVVVQ